MNDNHTGVITECAKKVSGQIARQDPVKLSQEAKGLPKKRQSIKASNPADRIELAELSKLINKRKVADIKKHNKERTEHV